MKIPGDISQKFKPRDFHVLSDPAQIRAIARPDRLQMLNLLTHESLTVSAVAKKLGMAPNRAHYHMQQLVKQGLVREVGTGTKRYREERFYLATAYHFVMDPRLACADRETSDLLMQSAESAFLDWRRKQILDVDLGEIASLVVRECLRLRAGETALLQFTPQGIELAEALLVEIEAVGAKARTRLWSRGYLMRTLDRNTADELAARSFLDPDLEAEVDAVIVVASNMPQGAPPSAAQLEKMPLFLESWSRWQHTLREKRTRYLELALPHRRQFEAGRAGVEAGASIYWRSVRTDYPALGMRARALLSTVLERATITLHCPRGTDLTLRVDPLHYLVNDGVISDEDRESGQCLAVIPAGSLVLLPLPGSATGTFVADYVFVGGDYVWDVEVDLQDGRITGVRAGEDAEAITGAISRASGQPDQLATLGIGINPAGQGPTGMPVLDGCLAGVVTASFGNNEILGGTVRATLDLNLPSASLTVHAGDRMVIEDGRLL